MGKPRTAKSAVLKATIPESGDVRVGVYVRRSTDEEHQPYSIKAQDTSLTAYIASQPGWRLAQRFADDASGATTNRPGLQRALAAARAGLIDVLLVYRVDRFSRRLRDLVDLLDQLTEAGVAFRSATEPIDTSTPMGRLLLQLLGMFAEFEREVIIDRVVAGMERQAAAGRWRGGQRPCGYQRHPDTQVLRVVEAESPIIRAIFSAYTDERIGSRAIAHRLNERGYRTVVGGPWSGHQVLRVLANRVYIGEISFRDVTVPNAHEPIIDPDTFELAQQILSARGDDHSRRASNSSDYLFTGKLRCPDCGKAMIGTAANGRSKRYRYYSCFARVRYGNQECSTPRLSADELDRAVLASMRDYYANRTDLIANAVDEARQVYTAGHAERIKERDMIDAELVKANTAVERYFTAFENGTMTEETAAPRLDKLGTKIKQLRQRRDELTEELDGEPTMPAPAELAEIVAHIDEVIDRDQPAQTKTLIDALVAEVKVTGPNQVVPIFRIPQPGQGKDPVRAMVETVGRVGLEPTAKGL
jgi:site-specific DNA recombinase